MTIRPGATIGILGSGQLGRMLALAARPLGYRVHVYSDQPDSPAAAVCDAETVGDYADVERVRAFARQVDVVTFEFENVPAACATAAEEVTLVRPAGRVLHITQHRLREKTFLRDHGIPVTPFAAVDEESLRSFAYPAVLKTAGFGYDGKGQAKVADATEALAAWERMNRQPAILERLIAFRREVSVVAARGHDGEFAHYGVMENAHDNHILDVSHAPAEGAAGAITITRAVLEALDAVGVVTVEFFEDASGQLMVNEVAPRVHNSGHLTIEACETSQFAQQIRAVCGLPLGSTRFHRPAAMANLLGDIWQTGEPDWTAALEAGAALHLYGKRDPRAGRKMGHLTVLAETAEEAVERVRAARRFLRG
jgi:5-(carboxyamino)imidazole ribonucleotide synthase